MSMSDPIADMLCRIRNAQATNKDNVLMSASKLKVAIAKVLLDEGYVSGFEVDDTHPTKLVLNVKLKYYAGEPVISTLKRVSRPGLRIYRSCADIPKVMNGLGVAIMSTPKGVMTDKSATTMKVGGEVLCTVT